MKQSGKKKTLHTKRYWFFYVFLYPIMWFLNLLYGFRRGKLSYDRKQHYLIYVNHQASLDPVHVLTALRKPVYFVAGQQLFHKGWISKLLTFTANPIAIRKGYGDPHAVASMFRYAKEGGDIAIFIEGNRTWTNRAVYVAPAAAKLAKRIGMPLMILNLEGGFGVDPRFGKKKRKGPFTASIRRIYSVEEMNAMSVEDLQKEIEQGMNVHDASRGERYRSPSRAEYLERLFFICPSCHCKDTLRSEGEAVRCSCCGREITYREDLSLRSDDPSCSVSTLWDWYRLQMDEVASMPLLDPVLAEDPECTLFDLDSFPKKKLSKGTMRLTADSLSIGAREFPLPTIVCASPVEGTMMQMITSDNKTYLVKGHDRFNAVKYCLYFDRMISGFASTGDPYYSLERK